MVPKKDGKKRFCIDYRKLNGGTVTENWPLPRIEDILDRLSGSKYFTILDQKTGYCQIEKYLDCIFRHLLSELQLV